MIFFSQCKINVNRFTPNIREICFIKIKENLINLFISIAIICIPVLF